MGGVFEVSGGGEHGEVGGVAACGQLADYVDVEAGSGGYGRPEGDAVAVYR